MFIHEEWNKFWNTEVLLNSHNIMGSMQPELLPRVQIIQYSQLFKTIRNLCIEINWKNIYIKLRKTLCSANLQGMMHFKSMIPWTWLYILSLPSAWRSRISDTSLPATRINRRLSTCGFLCSNAGKIMHVTFHVLL